MSAARGSGRRGVRTTLALGLAALAALGCSQLLDFSGEPAGGADGAVEVDAADPLPTDAERLPDAPGSCANGVPDPGETALDCGGPDCAPCETGSACLAGRDCAGGACARGLCEDHPRDCASARVATPMAPSGVVTIDPDGAGTVAPLAVYCEQTVAGGGWQLVSVVPATGVAAVPFVGAGYCASPSTPCAGQVHPAQVSSATEILIVDPPTGDWLRVAGFSGGATSALRYFSLERALTTGDLCTAPHICSDATIDPGLTATAEGYTMAYAPPLVQWWRLGGWWLGAGASPGQIGGNVLRTSYGAVNQLSARATAAGTSTAHSNGEQRVYARVPAVPAAP